jgi:hypothetical protein
MAILDPRTLEDLATHLREKPDLVTRRARGESWMTAAEIADWIKVTRGVEVSSEEIDEELLAWWRADPGRRPMRPAKYPGENTLARLWGHVDRVPRLPETELQSIRTDRPLDLEPTSLPPDAPVCFLSYAAPDLHFAARVRLFLSALGFDAWMYSRDIGEGEEIFETVRGAIDRADFLLALATPQSIASAWMWTEISYASARVIPSLVVFDGSDSRLTALLESWMPPRTRDDNSFFEPSKLPALRDAYAKYNSEARVGKYEGSTREFLFAMGSFTKCLYPRRPHSSTMHASFVDFERTMRSLREERFGSS